MKKALKKLLNQFGYEIVRNSKNRDPDILGDEQFMEIYSICKSYTMTSIQRMYTLYLSVKYVLENDLEGDFVECGVWRGGSSMLIATYLKLKGRDDKKIFLYDTFEGMTKPSELDVSVKKEVASSIFSKTATSEDYSNWCYADLGDVKNNLLSTGIKNESLHFVKGKVEETIPGTIPDKIALLRLDTDWYESTKHELEHLYPLLVEKGVLIIDDYGFWEGCKKAVMEYFDSIGQRVLLNRIDHSGRILIKNDNLSKLPSK